MTGITGVSCCARYGQLEKQDKKGEKELPHTEQRQAEYGALMDDMVKTEKLINDQPVVLVGKCLTVDWEGGQRSRSSTV